jgi:TPR repeat protein
VDTPLLFLRSIGKSRITVLVVWLVASSISLVAAGQTSSPAQTSEEVQRLTTECEQGKFASCVDLGDMYVNGRGVAKDETRAVTLCQRACDSGFAPACDKLKKPGK